MDDDKVFIELLCMNPFWRKHWCEGGVCGCLGCANIAGGLWGMGVTKQQWERVSSQLPIDAAINAEPDRG